LNRDDDPHYFSISPALPMSRIVLGQIALKIGDTVRIRWRLCVRSIDANFNAPFLLESGEFYSIRYEIWKLVSFKRCGLKKESFVLINI
jgi:hypothetical protein